MCRSEKWEVFLYGDKFIKVDRVSSVVLPRGVPPPGIVVSAPVLHPTWQRLHLLCVLPAFRALHGNEHVSGKSCFEPEVLRDVRVHGSSCGPCCDVVHSSFVRKHHRRRCSCRDYVLCVSRLHCFYDSYVQRGCMRRDVVCLWKFHFRLCIRFSFGQREADDGMYIINTSSTKRMSGAYACWVAGSAATTRFVPSITTTSRFKLKDKFRSEKWGCICGKAF